MCEEFHGFYDDLVKGTVHQQDKHHDFNIEAELDNK
jgi:hypothetical protein